MRIPRPMKAAGLLATCAMAIGTSRWTLARQPSPPDWRAKFTQAALQIPFDKNLPPQRDSGGLPPDVRVPAYLLKMRIAVARTRDTGQTPRIDFRITSDTAYPRLGIARGLNYVWKDFVGGQMRLLIIPADRRVSTHWLAVQSHNHPPSVRAPRLVIYPDSTHAGAPRTYALSACTEDCPNPLSWCYARDTTSSLQQAIKVPLAAIGQYFARNKVAFRARERE